MELNSNQILYIKNDLKAKGFNSGSLQDEILDHICCMVEGHMLNGQNFEAAYSISLQSFGDHGFSELKKEVKRQTFRKKFLNSSTLTSGIAACILMFAVVVDARDRPDIYPVVDHNGISSTFGNRMEPIRKVNKFHNGIDIRVPEGTPVKATASGVVITAAETEGYGIHVVIRHDDGFETMYAHLSGFAVQQGEKVSKGERIGLTGNTGRSTAPHLHYEIRKNGQHLDPADYLHKN